MLSGFNHNIRHQGILFHVQTEDSGIANPVVVTHIFVGGNIIASRRRSYEKFVKFADAAGIVETMMKEQHKEMMKDLVAGKFKGSLEAVAKLENIETPAPQPATPPASPVRAEEPAASSPSLTPEPLGRRPAVPPPATAPRPYRTPPIQGAAIPEISATPLPTLDTSTREDKTLDELILEFLEEERKPKP